MAEETQQTRMKLRDDHEAWQEAKETRIAANAEVFYCDGETDGAVMDASRQVLVVTKGKRDHPIYQQLFPTSPSEATKPVAGDSQRRFVENLIAGLSALATHEDPTVAALAVIATTLQATHDELQAAVKTRDACILKEMQALGVLRITLANAQRFYNSLYHRLQLLWPDRSRLVESCFATLKTRASKAPDPTDEDEDGEEEDEG
jgi:hypothetical protein